MAKAISRKVAVAAARVKTSVTLSPESFQRLGAAVVKEGMSQSEIVEWMINRLLSGYVVQVRGERIGDSPSRSAGAAPVESNDRRDTPGEASDPAAAAA